MTNGINNADIANLLKIIQATKTQEKTDVQKSSDDVSLFTSANAESDTTVAFDWASIDITDMNNQQYKEFLEAADAANIDIMALAESAGINQAAATENDTPAAKPATESAAKAVQKEIELTEAGFMEVKTTKSASGVYKFDSKTSFVKYPNQTWDLKISQSPFMHEDVNGIKAENVSYEDELDRDKLTPNEGKSELALNMFDTREILSKIFVNDNINISNILSRQNDAGETEEYCSITDQQGKKVGEIFDNNGEPLFKYTDPKTGDVNWARVIEDKYKDDKGKEQKEIKIINTYVPEGNADGKTVVYSLTQHKTIGGSSRRSSSSSTSTTPTTPTGDDSTTPTTPTGDDATTPTTPTSSTGDPTTPTGGDSTTPTSPTGDPTTPTGDTGITDPNQGSDVDVVNPDDPTTPTAPEATSPSAPDEGDSDGEATGTPTGGGTTDTPVTPDPTGSGDSGDSGDSGSTGCDDNPFQDIYEDEKFPE